MSDLLTPAQTRHTSKCFYSRIKKSLARFLLSGKINLGLPVWLSTRLHIFPLVWMLSNETKFLLPVQINTFCPFTQVQTENVSNLFTIVQIMRIFLTISKTNLCLVSVLSFKQSIYVNFRLRRKSALYIRSWFSWKSIQYLLGCLTSKSNSSLCLKCV